MAGEAASLPEGRWSDEAFARLSLAAAVATLGLKLAAWRMTGSVGFFSDALETLVNFAAALFALLILRIARRPPDSGHDFGHSKAEYFSSGFEGGLILFAAISMAAAAFERLLHPRPILELGIGLLLSSSALLVNLAVGATLVHAGRQRRAIVLEADGEHLLSDVWTSVGVIVGVALCGATGWTVLDPLTALAACAFVGFTGLRLVRRSVQGLLDAALGPDEVAAIALELERYAGSDVRWHALRTRQSGTRKFATFHLLVPGSWTVHQGHALCEHLEGVLAERVPGLVVQIHVEPIEDPESWMDQNLDHTPPVALACSLDPSPSGHPSPGKGRFALLARWARLFRGRRRSKGL